MGAAAAASGADGDKAKGGRGGDGGDAGYRDRAAERRKGVNPDYDDEIARLVDMDAEKTKYLGGDVKHTHLVKGLDYALLQKVRFWVNSEHIEDQNDPPAARLAVSVRAMLVPHTCLLVDSQTRSGPRWRTRRRRSRTRRAASGRRKEGSSRAWAASPSPRPGIRSAARSRCAIMQYNKTTQLALSVPSVHAKPLLAIPIASPFMYLKVTPLFGYPCLPGRAHPHAAGQGRQGFPGADLLRRHPARGRVPHLGPRVHRRRGGPPRGELFGSYTLWFDSARVICQAIAVCAVAPSCPCGPT